MLLQWWSVGCFLFFFLRIYYLFIYLFIGCVGSSLLHVGPSPAAASGGHSSPWRGLPTAMASPSADTGSAVRRVGLSSCGWRAPERRPSSCGTRAQPLHGMRDPPGPGPKPMFRALAGRFPTTAPPGKPCKVYYFILFYFLN